MSNPVDLLIVGGGPAGLGAARGYRAAGGSGRVLILSADSYAPYARPPLTKEYLRGELAASELPLAPDRWYEDERVELWLETSAAFLRPDRHEVELTDGRTISYRRLVLATGSAPTPLPVPGGDDPGLIYLRDRRSGETVRAIAERRSTVIVVGSGFIGCEAAASLARRGASVTLVSAEERPQHERLGPDASGRISQWLERDGVDLVLGDAVAAVSRVEEGWRVELASGRVLSGDAVVIGGGVAAAVDLAETAGLEIENGAISAGGELRTSDPDVWSAGDVVCALNPAAGRRLRVEHWGEAEEMGEIAGANASGEHRRWDGVPGFWSVIGDHTLKYAAWGDGYDRSSLVEGSDGWAVWYSRDSVVVGVLSCGWDDAYDRGRELVERGASLSEALSPSPSP